MQTSASKKPLLRISIPVRIKSQIAEIPSAGSVDWLMVCTILWLLIPSCSVYAG